MKWKKLVDNVEVTYALIVYKKNAEINKLFLEVQSFLDEFYDMVPDDISFGLPSMKNI